MRCNNHALARLNVRANNVMPIRQYTFDSQFKAFAARENVSVNMAIARIVPWKVLTFSFNSRRRYIKTTTPNFYLIFTVLCGSFGFVQSCKCTIVTFIQTPVALNG